MCDLFSPRPCCGSTQKSSPDCSQFWALLTFLVSHDCHEINGEEALWLSIAMILCRLELQDGEA